MQLSEPAEAHRQKSEYTAAGAVGQVSHVLLNVAMSRSIVASSSGTADVAAVGDTSRAGATCGGGGDAAAWGATARAGRLPARSRSRASISSIQGDVPVGVRRDFCPARGEDPCGAAAPS